MCTSKGEAASRRDDLWAILVDTVHALSMYKHHKRYVGEVMLKERPDISAKELAIQMNVPLGEAMVLLDELRGTSPSPSRAELASGSEKAPSRTLLDFND